MDQKQDKPEVPPESPQTPKWDKSPSQIGSDIANEFYPTTSLFNADLRRQITKAIEAEREVIRHYMTQMGRWWEKSQKKDSRDEV